MAKTRKTKKEKMRAATRVVPRSSPDSEHHSTSAEDASVFTFTQDSPAPQSSSRTVTHNYLPHLKEDLLRTGIVIGAIILAELILYFSLITR